MRRLHFYYCVFRQIIANDRSRPPCYPVCMRNEQRDESTQFCMTASPAMSQDQPERPLQKVLQRCHCASSYWVAVPVPVPVFSIGDDPVASLACDWQRLRARSDCGSFSSMAVSQFTGQQPQWSKELRITPSSEEGSSGAPYGRTGAVSA